MSHELSKLRNVWAIFGSDDDLMNICCSTLKLLVLFCKFCQHELPAWLTWEQCGLHYDSEDTLDSPQSSVLTDNTYKLSTVQTPPAVSCGGEIWSLTAVLGVAGVVVMTPDESIAATHSLLNKMMLLFILSDLAHLHRAIKQYSSDVQVTLSIFIIIEFQWLMIVVVTVSSPTKWLN